MSSTNPSAQGLDRNMGHRAPVVFSAAELARVTGLPVRQIRALIWGLYIKVDMGGSFR